MPWTWSARGVGFLSGLVASTGPVNTSFFLASSWLLPGFFLAYGLVKGAFLATEALGSAAVSMTKMIIFQSFGIVTWETLRRGLFVGSSLMLGSWLAKGVVMKMDPEPFRVVVEVLMLLAGLAMVWTALI